MGKTRLKFPLLVLILFSLFCLTLYANNNGSIASASNNNNGQTQINVFSASYADGCIYAQGTNYAAIWNQTSGTVVNTTSKAQVGQAVSGEVYEVSRGFLFFNTSGMADVARIFNVTLQFYVTEINNFASQQLLIQWGKTARPHVPLENDDYRRHYYYNLTSIIVNVGWNNVSLPTISVNMEYFTVYCLRSSKDYVGQPPSSNETIAISMREGDYPAKLYVTYQPKIETVHFIRYYQSPQQVNIPAYGSWVTINVSSIVNASANAILLRVENNGTTAYRADIKPNNIDTDDYDRGYLSADCHREEIVYLTPDKTFKAKVENSAVKIYVLGETLWDVVWLRVRKQKSIPQNSTWCTLKLNATEDETYDRQIAAIFKVYTTANLAFGIRAVGETDNMQYTLAINRYRYFIVPTNGTGHFQVYSQINVYTYVYLVGYIRTTKQIYYKNSPYVKFTLSTGWQTLNLSSYIHTKTALGIFQYFYASLTAKFYIRPYGSTEWHQDNVPHAQGVFFCGIKNYAVEVYSSSAATLYFVMFGNSPLTVNKSRPIYYFYRPIKFLDKTGQFVINYQQFDLSLWLSWDSSFVMCIRNATGTSVSFPMQERPHLSGETDSSTGIGAPDLFTCLTEVRNGIIELFINTTGAGSPKVKFYLAGYATREFFHPISPRQNVTDAIPSCSDPVNDPKFYDVHFNVPGNATGVILETYPKGDEGYFAIRLPGDTAWGIPDNQSSGEQYARKQWYLHHICGALNGSQYGNVLRSSNVVVFVIGYITSAHFTYAQAFQNQVLPASWEWKIVDMGGYASGADFIFIHTYNTIEETWWSWKVAGGNVEYIGAKHQHPWIFVNLHQDLFEVKETGATARWHVYGYYRFFSTWLNIGWTNFTVANEDVGHSLAEICANINGEGIQAVIVIKFNGTEYRYDYGEAANANVKILNTGEQLRVYSHSEGYWAHGYDKFVWQHRFRQDTFLEQIFNAARNLLFVFFQTVLVFGQFICSRNILAMFYSLSHTIQVFVMTKTLMLIITQAVQTIQAFVMTKILMLIINQTSHTVQAFIANVTQTVTIILIQTVTVFQTFNIQRIIQLTLASTSNVSMLTVSTKALILLINQTVQTIQAFITNITQTVTVILTQIVTVLQTFNTQKVMQLMLASASHVIMLTVFTKTVMLVFGHMAIVLQNFWTSTTKTITLTLTNTTIVSQTIAHVKTIFTSMFNIAVTVQTLQTNLHKIVTLLQPTEVIQTLQLPLGLVYTVIISHLALVVQSINIVPPFLTQTPVNPLVYVALIFSIAALALTIVRRRRTWER